MWSQGHTEKEGHQQTVTGTWPPAAWQGALCLPAGTGQRQRGCGGGGHRAHVQPALWEGFESSESEELKRRMGLQELELYRSSNRK